jgi:hypothetical protein
MEVRRTKVVGSKRKFELRKTTRARNDSDRLGFLSAVQTESSD